MGQIPGVERRDLSLKCRHEIGVVELLDANNNLQGVDFSSAAFDRPIPAIVSVVATKGRPILLNHPIVVELVVKNVLVLVGFKNERVCSGPAENCVNSAAAIESVST